ncbi:hypothetical protein BGZ51_001600 [Haplosporangium sp. Z 767]|nr:hypothetical protein BGZ50_002274 [Haplosporangium sp. Z 11]KAF9187027.1 hypothetical protein BGZ51_001600 [Haplosporangium sp. Z 767]
MGNSLCCQNDLDDTPHPPQSVNNNNNNNSSGSSSNTNTLTAATPAHNSVKMRQRLQEPRHVPEQAIVQNSINTPPKNSMISKFKDKSSHLHPPLSSSSSPSSDFSSSQSTLPASVPSFAPITTTTEHVQGQPGAVRSRNTPVDIQFARTHSGSTGNTNGQQQQQQQQQQIQRNHRSGAQFTVAASSENSSYSIERKMERDQISTDFQWLEGRRYHNTPGASYLLPNDIDEVDRLQLQHFVLRYAIQGNYKSPLDKSKVRAILDVGCGPGTWTMEMANEFPDATITGIDMSAVFPSTIVPSNCRFIQHNILSPLPFPDNTFDFVYQRLLIAGLKPDDWVKVLAELERVTKPGGWIELVEVDGVGGDNGPYTAKIWSWVDQALSARGINCQIGREPGLVPLLKQAKVVNVKQEVLRLPTGDHGGKIGKLLKENEHSFWSAITPMVIHGAGVDKEEYEEAIRISSSEVEEYKSYHIFYVVTGQKRETTVAI